jgi:hypothetical protein
VITLIHVTLNVCILIRAIKYKLIRDLCAAINRFCKILILVALFLQPYFCNTFLATSWSHFFCSFLVTSHSYRHWYIHPLIIVRLCSSTPAHPSHDSWAPSRRVRVLVWDEKTTLDWNRSPPTAHDTKASRQTHTARKVSPSTSLRVILFESLTKYELFLS